MIKVIASSRVKNDCVDLYLKITKELVEKTNALDKGCIKYELCRDVNDPLRFIMLEEWEDKPSLDMHMESKHFTELIPGIRELTESPSELTLLEKCF